MLSYTCTFTGTSVTFWKGTSALEISGALFAEVGVTRLKLTVVAEAAES